MPPSSTDVTIPNSCSSEQLFKDADEVVKLATDLATLEDKYDKQFLQYFEKAPSGYSEESKRVWALSQIKENHTSLWLEIDTTRARMRGLQMKSQIVRTAISVIAVETGHFGVETS